jgi:hypothetical protein
VRIDGASPAIDLVPRTVPQDHEKAYSPERADVLLRAYLLAPRLVGSSVLGFSVSDDGW